MMSDFLYVSPLHHTLKLHSKTTPNTFMYILKYEGEAKVLDGTSRQDIRESQFGINHMEYERYLFNKALRKSGRYHNRLRNKNVIENLCKIWGNFIKLRFLPQELKWKQFGNYNQMNYAEISEIITPRTGYRRNEIEFWTLLVPDLDSIQNLNTEFPEEIPFDKITSSAWSAVGLAILFGVLCVSLVGVVVVTRSRMAQLSILPISSPKEDIKYSNI